MQKTLNQLYKEHTGKLSDKWSLYLTELDRLFTPYRNHPIQLLEIGIQNGGSLEIWDQYFPNARKIIGCDINQKCAALRYESPRIAVVTGDANSDESQREILWHASTFDIIIDDGSHRSSDIVRSFAHYFPYLNDNGIYVVEDLHCSYWNDYGGGLHYPLSAMSFFKRLTDILNHEHWRNNKSRGELVARFGNEFGVKFDDLDISKIHSIEFVNSLCAIRKLPSEENILGRRVIVGMDEYITSGAKKYNDTFIQDFDAEINDDGDLDIFELIERNNAHLQSITAFNSQLAEKESAIQMLIAQVNEKQQELAGIKISKAWRLALLFRRIRHIFTPSINRGGED